MKRAHADESSLELLLDTMCNTFGGVIFIAISLVVVISGIKSAMPESAPETPETLRQLEIEMAAVVDLLRAQENASREVEQELKFRDLEANREQLRRILIQENAATTAGARLALHRDRLKIRLLAAAKLERAIPPLEAETEKLRVGTETARAAADRLSEALAAMSREPAPPALHFQVRQPSSLSPYFVLVQNNRCWRVGPELDASGNDSIHADVASARSGDLVHCTPQPERGIPLLENGALSAGVRALVASPGRERRVLFEVAPSGAKAFFAARQALRTEKLEHGWTPLPDESGFRFRYASEVKYEY